jgi:PKD repeat protein
MPLTARTFLLATFVLCISHFLVATTAQESNDVVIRSSRKSEVVVSVRKGRVRVGELVTFTLTPASIVTNPAMEVTVDFGDGTRIKTRQTVVTHRYRSLGHYDVYATVKSAAGPDIAKPQRPIPSVSLSASPTALTAGGAVNFSAQLSQSYPGIKYRFVFGDGSQTDWQNESSTRYAYRTPGTFSAYVDLGLGQGGAIRQVGGSIRRAIVVSPSNINFNNTNTNNNPKDPRPNDDDRLPRSVQLSANPVPVQVTKPVTFMARVPSSSSKLRYRFVFGDGSSAGWQTSAETTHAYKSAGRYAASVSIGVASQRSIRPLAQDGQSIAVIKTAPVAVDFNVAPLPVQEGKPVSFTAKSSSTEADVRYRFIFGDQTSSGTWQTSPQASYSYLKAGEYSAYVELGRSTGAGVEPVGRSSSKTISVSSGAVALASPTPVTGGPTASPGSSPSPGGPAIGSVSENPDAKNGDGGLPKNWWIYLLIALLLIFIAYQTYRAFFVPKVMMYPNVDPGTSDLDAGAKGLEINTQVLMRPDVSNAHYLVHSPEGDLVRSVRRENV